MKSLLHLYLAAIGAVIAISLALPVLARHQVVFVWIVVLGVLGVVVRVVWFYTRF